MRQDDGQPMHSDPSSADHAWQANLPAQPKSCNTTQETALRVQKRTLSLKHTCVAGRDGHGVEPLVGLALQVLVIPEVVDLVLGDDADVDI